MAFSWHSLTRGLSLGCHWLVIVKGRQMLVGLFLRCSYYILQLHSLAIYQMKGEISSKCKGKLAQNVINNVKIKVSSKKYYGTLI